MMLDRHIQVMPSIYTKPGDIQVLTSYGDVDAMTDYLLIQGFKTVSVMRGDGCATQYSGNRCNATVIPGPYAELYDLVKKGKGK